MDSTYRTPSGITRTGRRILAGVAAFAVAASAAVAGAGLYAASTANAAEDQVSAGVASSAINGYRSVGYFAQWGVYGRGYQVK